MNYHVFHDSFTGDIEYSGIFDLLPKENKSGDFGRVEGSFQNRRIKGSQALTHPTQSATTYLSGVCQQSALTHSSVTTKKKGEAEHN